MYSYKTDVDGTTYNLLLDVVLCYLFYLQELGFIDFSFSYYDSNGKVLAPLSVMPQKDDYAKALKFALSNVNERSPDINDQIENMLYQFLKDKGESKSLCKPLN